MLWLLDPGHMTDGVTCDYHVILEQERALTCALGHDEVIQQF